MGTIPTCIHCPLHTYTQLKINLENKAANLPPVRLERQKNPPPLEEGTQVEPSSCLATAGRKTELTLSQVLSPHAPTELSADLRLVPHTQHWRVSIQGPEHTVGRRDRSRKFHTPRTLRCKGRSKPPCPGSAWISHPIFLPH